MNTIQGRVFLKNLPALLAAAFLLFGGLKASAQTVLDPQTAERFFNAIAMHDTNTASQLLESNTNLVYARNNFSKLPLLEAAAAGDVSLVKRMLELGADINAEGDTFNSGGSRMTALDEAARYGHGEICKLLLEAGANPNHRAFQDTTLHFAFDNFVFSTNRIAAATFLLEYGANPFAEAGYYKTTPLELAITKGDGRLVPLMLDTDRKIKSAPGSRPRSPTKKPTASASEQAARFLAAHGAAMLSAAAQRGELEAVQALLNAGVSTKTNAPDDLPVLQSFAISEAAAVRGWPSALAQWQQTSNQLKNLGTNANPQFLASIQSQAAQQLAKVESLSPERWRQIRDLLIKNGAGYDAFAATAMADTAQATRLLAADKNVVLARDRDGQTLLHWAVLNDQLSFTSFWLQAGTSPAATNFAGQTPLHLAVSKGLVEHVKILLAANPPLDARDTNGWTPLDAAIQAKQSDCIHLLMVKAPPTSHSERGLATPLHAAATSRNVAVLAALLETETNLEARNELGLTPLQVAVLHGHLATAALLVDKGADVNIRDPQGNSLLHQILLQDQLTIYDRPPASWLERAGQDPSKRLYVQYLTVGQYEQGPNPLLQAASFLLASGAQATATNHAGETAMQLITDEKTGRGVFFFDDDREKLLQLLSAHGSNVDERDADGNTALHRLCTGYYDVGKVERMVSLIASGADVNATNNLGQTPLHIASEKINGWDGNNPPVNEPFQLLIFSKADVNAQDNQGLTPLHVVALSDSSFRTEATRALLDAGANPGLRDKQGRTPAHLFLSGKWPWGEAGGCIDMLVAAGADLSAKDDQGRTPLHYLAMLGSQNPMFFIHGIGDTLAQAKVDINARDNEGNTPLHLAAKTGTRDVFDWLAKQGVDLDTTNNASETPRQLAMRSTDPFSRSRLNAATDIFQAIREGKLESVAAILKSEPGLLNKNNQVGQTPLLTAAQFRRTNIVEFLDRQGAQWDPKSAILAGRTNILRQLIAQQPRLAADGSLLRLAAIEGNLPAAETLLVTGVDLKATDSFGLSPLGNALASKHNDIADLLVKRGAVKNIFDAVFSGDSKTATTLIEHDKSLAFSTNAAGFSVAEIATATGRDEILKSLLIKGVSPDFRNARTGQSLLFLAADYNQTNTAELLVRRRARLNEYDHSGLAPAHIAALRGFAEVLELLLHHKADGNLRTEKPDESQPPGFGAPSFFNRRMAAPSGNTPLHLAAMAGQTNALVRLLKWGAAVNATNAGGMTPLDLASSPGLPPFLTFERGNLRLPFTSSAFPPNNLMSHRNDVITLLEQAGGKRSEPRGPNGMTFSRPPSAPPAQQSPVSVGGREYHDRGCNDFNSRRFTSALANFRKACELGSDIQDYSCYRIWILRTRLGEKAEATKELTAYLEHRKPQSTNDWPLQIGRFLTGQLSEDDFIKAADSPNSQTVNEQHCEAYFFIGSKRLVENDAAGAADFFEKCQATNLPNYEEYQSAAAELLFLKLAAPRLK